MTHEEAVWEILASRRNVGATLRQVVVNVKYRTGEAQAKKRALGTLRSLQSDGQLTVVGDRWFLTPKGYKRAKGSAQGAVWQE